MQFGVDFARDEEYLELCRQFERAFSRRQVERKRKQKYQGQNVHRLRLKRYANK